MIAADDEVRADDERKDQRPPEEQRRDHGEREPDDAEAADVRKRDEDRVERLGAMPDDPPLEPLIETDHIRRRRGSAAPPQPTMEAELPRRPTNASAEGASPERKAKRARDKLERQDLLRLVDQLLRVERLADERRCTALLGVRARTARRPGR